MAEVSKALPDHFAAKLTADAGDHLKNLSGFASFSKAATRADRDNVGAEREPIKFALLLELRPALRCGQMGPDDQGAAANKVNERRPLRCMQ